MRCREDCLLLAIERKTSPASRDVGTSAIELQICVSSDEQPLVVLTPNEKIFTVAELNPALLTSRLLLAGSSDSGSSLQLK